MHTPKLVLFYLLCILTLGFLWLISTWFPQLRVTLTCKRTRLADAQFYFIQDAYDRSEIVKGYRVQNGVQLVVFEYRHTRFVVYPEQGRIESTAAWREPSWEKGMSTTGLTQDKVVYRQAYFGENVIDPGLKPAWKILVDDVLHPFYVFQVFSMILWCFDNYFIYAGALFVISVVSVTLTFVQTQRNMVKLQTLTRYTCMVRVLRNGAWIEVSSKELVPGDVMDVASVPTFFPCDAFLTAGDVVVNESMLTGESLPVSKSVVTPDVMAKFDPRSHMDAKDVGRHILFSGTRAMRVRAGVDGVATAVVVRTGCNTVKGQLVRSILYPKPDNFSLYQDAFKFLGVLAVIATVGFVLSIIQFIRLELETSRIIIRALDIITTVVPPALPLTVSVGISYALSRLGSAGIFCIAPTRINVAGKINLVCYDKTGTLTQEGLDVHGVRVASNDIQGFTPEVNHMSPLITRDMTQVMAGCNDVKFIHGELHGDPMELQLLRWTGWELEEVDAASKSSALAKKMFGTDVKFIVHPPSRVDASPGIGIFRTFAFDATLRRMTVLASVPGHAGVQVLCKGAPESIAPLCLEGTLPANYDLTLRAYAERGYRVLACAARLATISHEDANKMMRDEFECNMVFLGFVAFENKLKAETVDVIAELNEAQIRQVMCTGDALETAVSVARDCGLLRGEERVYASQIEADGSVVWVNVDRLTDRIQLDGIDVHIDNNWTTAGNKEIRKSWTNAKAPVEGGFALAVTGDAFVRIMSSGHDSLLRVLSKCQVYARMSPDEKRLLVELLNRVGYRVAFCGDGANDCAALKAADVGVSLSDLEASIAAPFTSRIRNIKCMPSVIREGRSALVTSFMAFKYMALYSMIQFTTLILLYSNRKNLGNWEFLYIDLVIILSIALLMGRTEAAPTLAAKRPTASLVSGKVLTSLVGHVLVQALFQSALLVFTKQQPWYVDPLPTKGRLTILSADTTTLFLFSSLQYISLAIVFSVGKPYRKPFYTNVPFALLLVFLTVSTLYLLLIPPPELVAFVEMVELPNMFRMVIGCVGLVYFGVAYLLEVTVFPWVARTGLM